MTTLSLSKRLLRGITIFGLYGFGMVVLLVTWSNVCLAVCGHGDMHSVLGLTCCLIPNFRLQWGDTPLHDSAGKGHTEVTSILIDANADPNAVNKVSGEFNTRVPIHTCTLYFILQSVYPRVCACTI